MPELPEVETVRRGLAPLLIGRTIKAVRIHDHRLRWPVPKDLDDRLRGRQIVALTRRAKYLLLTLDDDRRVILHLGMSGRLQFIPADRGRLKHDHVEFDLGDGQCLVFNDPRRFGAILPWHDPAVPHVLLDKLGPEPFDPSFDSDYLHQRSRKRSRCIKSFIMDAELVVGVGNIYANEALFRAGIRPSRPAGRLSHANCQRLVQAIRDVLLQAIAAGGTTLRDFVDGHGSAGYFQQQLDVYGRAGLPCRRCDTPLRSDRITNRATTWCPRCQR